MIRTAMLALLLAAVFSPLTAKADWWTEGQAQWARHGGRHGAWDCYGRCPEGRSHRRHHYRD